MSEEEKERKKIIRDFFRSIGKKGGKKTSSRYGHDHFVGIGKMGGRPRKPRGTGHPTPADVTGPILSAD